MSDYPSNQEKSSTHQVYIPQQNSSDQNDSIAMYTKVVYVLYIISVLSVGATLFIGVLIAYVKRGDANGTIYREHLDHLIKIFWYAVIWYVIGMLTFFFFIGGVIIFLTSLWVLVKSVLGLIKCIDGKPLR